MIRELTLGEVEDVSGGECGVAAAAGAAAGGRFGPKGAVIGFVASALVCYYT